MWKTQPIAQSTSDLSLKHQTSEISLKTPDMILKHQKWQHFRLQEQAATCGRTPAIPT